MGRYSAELNRTASATLGLGTIVADATTVRRMRFYDLALGSEAAPADNAFLWTVDRVSGTPAGSAVTAQPLDPADAAALADVLEALTGNGTVGVRLLSIPLNQRASFRWVAAPGSELGTPATAGNGIIIQTPTASTVAITGTVLFTEE